MSGLIVSSIGSRVTGKSECLGPREQAAVHGVNDWLCANLPTAKVSSIQSFDGIFASADTLELEVNIALGVGIERDVDDMAILLFAFSSDIVLEFFDPRFTFFPVGPLAIVVRDRNSIYLLGRIEHVSEQDASTRLADINRKRFRFFLGGNSNTFRVCLSRGFVGPGKFAHQCISTVIVEVHTRDVCIIQGTCTTGALVVVTATCTVECASRSAGMRATTASS